MNTSFKPSDLSSFEFSTELIRDLPNQPITFTKSQFPTKKPVFIAPSSPIAQKSPKYFKLKGLPSPTAKHTDLKTLNKINRNNEFPFSAIISIEIEKNNGQKHYASGCMLGPRMALTSSSILSDAKNIIVLPARYRSESIFGKHQVIQVIQISAEETKSEPGYALLVFNENIGDYTGWFGLMSLEDQDLVENVTPLDLLNKTYQEKTAYNTGYDSLKNVDKNANLSDQYMKTIGVKIVDRSSLPTKFKARDIIGYTLDDHALQNGSPLWIKKGKHYYVIGLHNHMTTFEKNYFGLRVTPSVLEQVIQKINAIRLEDKRLSEISDVRNDERDDSSREELHVTKSEVLKIDLKIGVHKAKDIEYLLTVAKSKKRIHLDFSLEFDQIQDALMILIPFIGYEVYLHLEFHGKYNTKSMKALLEYEGLAKLKFLAIRISYMISDPDDTVDLLGDLKMLPRLDRLKFDGLNEFWGEDLLNYSIKSIGSLNKLTDLRLFFNETAPIREESFVKIANEVSKLKFLAKFKLNFSHTSHLSEKTISKFFDHLTDLNRLKKLNFEETNLNLSDHFLNSIHKLTSKFKSITKLIIMLSDCPYITDDGLQVFTENFRTLGLEKLFLKFGHSSISDLGVEILFERIRSSKHLKKLHMDFSDSPLVSSEFLSITAYGLEFLASKISQLSFKLNKCHQSIDDNIIQFSKLIKTSENLRTFKLNFSNLAKLTNYSYLILGEAVGKLQHVRDLSLNLENSNISTEGLAILSDSLDKLKLVEFVDISLPSNTVVQQQALKQLASSFQNMNHMIKFALNIAGSKYFEDECIIELGNSINNMNILEQFTLLMNDCSMLSDKGVARFAKSFTKTPLLKSFTLEMNSCEYIGDYSLSHIGKSLYDKRFMVHLQISMLDCRSIGTFGLNSLGNSLKEIKTLEHLFLEFNNIELNISHIQRLFSSFGELRHLKLFFLNGKNVLPFQSSDFKLLGRSLAKTRVDYLNLHFEKNLSIEKEHFKLISSKFKELPNLRVLDLDFSRCPNIDWQGFFYLSEALSELNLHSLSFNFADNPSIVNSTLGRIGYHISKQRNLSKLSILLDGVTNIDDDGFQSLTKAIKGHSNLSQLTLDLLGSFNGKNKLTLPYLADSIFTNSQLTHLNLNLLSIANIAKEPLEAICATLGMLKNMRELYLALEFGDYETDSIMIELAESLLRTKELRELGLTIYYPNEHGQEGMQYFGDTLKTLGLLRFLRLEFRKSEMSEKCYDAIFASLGNLTQLASLRLVLSDNSKLQNLGKLSNSLVSLSEHHTLKSINIELDYNKVLGDDGILSLIPGLEAFIDIYDFRFSLAGSKQLGDKSLISIGNCLKKMVTLNSFQFKLSHTEFSDHSIGHFLNNFVGMKFLNGVHFDLSASKAANATLEALGEIVKLCGALSIFGYDFDGCSFNELDEELFKTVVNSFNEKFTPTNAEIKTQLSEQLELYEDEQEDDSIELNVTEEEEDLMPGENPEFYKDKIDTQVIIDDYAGIQTPKTS